MNKNKPKNNQEELEELELKKLKLKEDMEEKDTISKKKGVEEVEI